MPVKLDEIDIDNLANMVKERHASKKLTLYPATHDRIAWTAELVTSMVKKGMGFGHFRDVFGASPPWNVTHSDVIDLLILLLLREMDPKLREGIMPKEVLEEENIMKILNDKLELLNMICPEVK